MHWNLRRADQISHTAGEAELPPSSTTTRLAPSSTEGLSEMSSALPTTATARHRAGNQALCALSTVHRRWIDLDGSEEKGAVFTLCSTPFCSTGTGHANRTWLASSQVIPSFLKIQLITVHEPAAV